MNRLKQSAGVATKNRQEPSAGGARDYTARRSAGGARDYSPERSAAELRDMAFFAANPWQGVTEVARLSLASSQNTDSVAPFQGLSSVCLTTREFRCAPLPALIRRARWALRASLV